MFRGRIEVARQNFVFHFLVSGPEREARLGVEWFKLNELSNLLLK